MDYLSSQSQWSLPHHVGSGNPPPNDGSGRADDWTRDQNGAGPSNHVNQVQHALPQQIQQPTIDINDPTASFSFGDLPVPAPATSQSPPTPGYPVWPPFNYYAAYQYPYPVSNYSTLNGATTPTALPQQTSPAPIDPSLAASTSTGQTQAYNGVHHAAISPYLYTNPIPHQSQQPAQPILAVDPSLLLNHSTTPVATPTLAPSAPKAKAHVPPKAPLMDVLKPILTPSKLVGSSTVGILVKVLEQYNYPEIDCDIRIELFSKLSVHADDQFFKAFVENSLAMDITRNWLKAGAADKEGGPWKASINPILSAVGRMRFTIETLQSAKLGKIIIKLTRDSNSATRDLSLELEKRWRILIAPQEGNPSLKKEDDSDENKLKKRKLADTAPIKPAPPSKRVALASTPPVKPVPKKEPVKKVIAVKDAKSDSSFFSAKPKAKLPSFNKKPLAPPMKPPSTTSENVSKPSSFDPFQEVLKAMKRTASPKTTRATPPLSTSGTPSTSQLGKGANRKKRVTFAPEGELEQIKFIERAVYEDDVDLPHGVHSLRELDRSEGAALHMHLFEEQVDWSDPLSVECDHLTEYGEKSSERITQEERERSALSAVYLSTSQIPDSPAEHVATESSGPEPTPMKLGEHMETLMSEQAAPASISDLLASLPGAGSDLFAAQQAVGQLQNTQPAISQTDPHALLDFLQNFQLNLQQNGGMQNIYQQMQQFEQNSAALPAPNSDTWGAGFQELQQQGAYNQMDDPNNSQWEPGDQGWGRGRVPGRAKGKKRPCSFWQQGRCKYGDQCDFAHE